MRLKVSLFFVLVAIMHSISGQNTGYIPRVGDTVNIALIKGEEYVGIISTLNDESITISTFSGSEIKILRSNLKSIKQEIHTEFSFPHKHYTRYFFGPNGFMLDKKSGYYNNYLLVFNGASYGITDHITIGGGFEFISTILGRPIWFLTPKIGTSISERVHLAGGAYIMGLADEGVISLPYGVLSFGTREANITVGSGIGFASGESEYVFAGYLGFSKRLTNAIAIQSENYTFRTPDLSLQYFGIHGVRIMSGKNAFDLGVMIIGAIISDIPGLPFVGYARHF